MKKIILACAAAACITAGFTAKATDYSVPVTVVEDDNKTQVDPAALPDAVKTTLSGDAYKGWTVSTAWLVKNGNSEYYEIQLSKDNQKNTVKLDKDGKTV
jgi:hypothetical protein